MYEEKSAAVVSMIVNDPVPLLLIGLPSTNARSPPSGWIIKRNPPHHGFWAVLLRVAAPTVLQAEGNSLASEAATRQQMSYRLYSMCGWFRQYKPQ